MSESSADESGDCSAPEFRLLVRGAERLVSHYGDRADMVAAHLADASFTAGDHVAGRRWAQIFRMLAASHASNADRRRATTAGLH